MSKRLKPNNEECIEESSKSDIMVKTCLMEILPKAETNGKGKDESSMMISQNHPLLIFTIVENLFTNTSLCNDLNPLKACRLVCTLWNKTIVPMMCKERGVESRKTIQIFKDDFVKTPDLISAYNEFRSTMLSAPLGLFTRFSFQSDHYEINIGELGEHFVSDFLTSYGANIKQLELPKNIPIGQLLTILKTLCPNLKDLDIYDFEFKSKSDWKYTDSETDVYINQILKKPLSLTRLSFRINWETYETVSKKRSLSVLISLMKISPFLDVLSMHETDGKFCYEFCKQIKKFPEITKKLKSLNIEGNIIYADNFYTSSVIEMENVDLSKLTQLSLIGEHTPLPKTAVNQLLVKLSSKLERLSLETQYWTDIDDYNLHVGPIQFPILDKLTHLNLAFLDNVHPIESLEFLKNMPKLQNLNIQFHMAGFAKESLSILREMKALKKLKMGIYRRSIDDMFSMVNLEEFFHIPLLRNFILCDRDEPVIGDEDLVWVEQKMKEKNVFFSTT